MKALVIQMGVLAIFFQVNAQDSIKGVWLAGDGKSKVEIKEKDSLTYYGKIVWLEQPTDSRGKPLRDKQNPDKSLRDRTILEMIILEDLKYDSGRWYGTIYTPKYGRTMDVNIYSKIEDELTLEISYRGFKKEQKWIRSTLSN